MTGILFVLIVFGGGMLVVLSKTEIGRAISDRIRGATPGSAADPALLEEVDRLRNDVAELQERMEFAERLLASKREAGQLGNG
jgi:ubiquinone biosynthesis protein UbiJ